MRILIGTPIHRIKDYAMERWLENIAKLALESPADLLMVDNSPDTEYMETVRGYCAKYGITNYKIVHIDFDQGMSVSAKDKRIEAAQKIIREEILSHDYDAWFSWECDDRMGEVARKDAARTCAKDEFCCRLARSHFKCNCRSALIACGL